MGEEVRSLAVRMVEGSLTSGWKAGYKLRWSHLDHKGDDMKYK